MIHISNIFYTPIRHNDFMLSHSTLILLLSYYSKTAAAVRILFVLSRNTRTRIASTLQLKNNCIIIIIITVVYGNIGKNNVTDVKRVVRITREKLLILFLFLTRTYTRYKRISAYYHYSLGKWTTMILYYTHLYYVHDPIIRFYNISFKIKLNKLLIRNNSKHQVYILTSCVIFF